jgi:hypothetical protein
MGRARHDLYLEALEARVLLSGSWARIPVRSVIRAHGAAPVELRSTIERAVNPADLMVLAGDPTPAQMRAAYGIDQVMFGSVVGDGSGQTVAIVDAYDYSKYAMTDLQAFDAAMGLPDLQEWSPTGNTGAWLRVVSQRGGTDYPSTDPKGAGNGTWETEEALDIQWVHAIAPGANIILVEADSALPSDLLTAAVGWARNEPGVSVVSMSFGSSEYSGETSNDYLFTTPIAHSGITFLAATGDKGQPSSYPAYSPNVVAVGGTTLTTSNYTYVSEIGWSGPAGVDGSGGGLSTYESQPAYQTGIVTQSSTKRANPDVAMDADPATGVMIYDSWDWPGNPWGNGYLYGGTSLATPMWAGIVAIINQGRLLNGLATLDGATQTLPMLYGLPGDDFHDITVGNNGYSAGVGYDLVTGRGSPVANQLIPDMVFPAGAAPGAVVLSAASDTGISSTDGITYYNNSSSAKALTFNVGGTIAGATVSVYANGTLIGTTVASGTTTSVTSNGTYALASGSYSVTARQRLPGFAASAASTAFTLKVDTTAPAVTAQSPSGSVLVAQTDVTFTFNEAIATTSFSLEADIASFTGPTGNDLRGQITGATWSSGNTVLDVSFSSQSVEGSYQMVLGPQIYDVAGNMMMAAYAGSFAIATMIYSANMDANPGWTLTGGWAYGVPTGGGTQNHDPTGGHTGSNVVGYNLTGNYAPNAAAYYATTPAINCSNYQGLTLQFYRWLGVGSSAVASILATYNNGSTWTTLWANSGAIVVDTSWLLRTYALPSSFDGKSAVRIRWVMGPTLGGSTYPGWNIDDVSLVGAVIPPPSINGQVFVDANGGGTLDGAEAGLPGVTVFLDTNGNGVPDGGESTTTTDANGNYHFIVSAGTYNVCEVVPSTYVAVAGTSQSVTATTTVTGVNFADFPTIFTPSATGSSYYLTASNGTLQISVGNVPLAAPTYQIAANLLTSLTFNLAGPNETLFADFTDGALGVNITLNAVSGLNDTLTILGQGTGQTFTMNDYQIGPTAGGGTISYNNVDTVDLLNSKVYYSGALATIQHLIVDSGCWLVWG